MGLHYAFFVLEEQLDGLQYPVTAPPLGGPEYDQWFLGFLVVLFRYNLYKP